MDPQKTFTPLVSEPTANTATHEMPTDSTIRGMSPIELAGMLIKFHELNGGQVLALINGKITGEKFLSFTPQDLQGLDPIDSKLAMEIGRVWGLRTGIRPTQPLQPNPPEEAPTVKNVIGIDDDEDDGPLVTQPPPSYHATNPTDVGDAKKLATETPSVSPMAVKVVFDIPSSVRETPVLPPFRVDITSAPFYSNKTQLESWVGGGAKAYKEFEALTELYSFPNKSRSCPYARCAHSSKTKATFVDHIVPKHIKYPRYGCRQCDRSFLYVKDLASHQCDGVKGTETASQIGVE